MLTIQTRSAIYNLIHEIRVPPRGIYEIGLTINDRLLYVSRPCINDIPILKNVSAIVKGNMSLYLRLTRSGPQFSLYPLFRCLSPHLILAIMEVRACECKSLVSMSILGLHDMRYHLGFAERRQGSLPQS